MIEWLVKYPQKNIKITDTISEKDYLENELDKHFGDFNDFDTETAELLLDYIGLPSLPRDKVYKFTMFKLKIAEQINDYDLVPLNYKAMRVLHLEKQKEKQCKQ